MRQDIQKRILRVTIVFTLVLGLVYGAMELGFGKPSRYEVRTTMVLFPREQNSESLSQIDSDMAAVFNSDSFQKGVADARYRETEEWQSFSLRVEHPVSGVFVFSYRDGSLDPYSAREAMTTVRREAFLAVSRRYDVLRGIEPRFLDAGNVAEWNVFQYETMYALLVASGVAIAWELFLFLFSTRHSGRALQRAVREKIQESSAVRPWWLAPPSSSEHGQSGLVLKEEGETYLQPEVTQIQKKEKETSFFKEEVKKDTPLESLQNRPKHEVKEIFQKDFSTNAPPQNLPVLSEIPDILKATWKSGAFKENAVPAESEEAVPERTTQEAETLSNDQNIETEEEIFPADTDTVLFDSPVKNPEPTAEELKERLNKLLRGEMG